ncbi:MAG: hypothetical protein KJ043_04930 [Anaerolineae bacterium]|nr:hypothetical protein [Anaerolineae bacterium]
MNNVDDMDDFFMSDGSYWQAPDFILTDIITTMVNMMEMPVGITIFMKGMIVSGSLVSERQYLGSLSAVFQALASASFEGAEDDAEMKDELHRLFDFTKLTENDYSMMDEDEDDPQPDTPLEDESDFDLEMDEESFDFDEFYDMKKSSVVPVRFMHLRDAMVLYPGASIGFRHSILPIIRIRINSIDGWILGQALDASELDGDDEPRPMVH